MSAEEATGILNHVSRSNLREYQHRSGLISLRSLIEVIYKINKNKFRISIVFLISFRRLKLLIQNPLTQPNKVGRKKYFLSNQGTHPAEGYPDFFFRKRLGIILLPPPGLNPSP